MTVIRSSGGIQVNLTETNLRQALQLLDQAPGRARAAVANAMNESVRWGNTQIRRDIAKQAMIPQKYLKGRMKLWRANRNKLRAGVWAGTNPMLAKYIGAPVKTATGYKFGRHDFPGAFEATMDTGHTDIFVRSSVSLEIKPAKRWTHGRPRTSSPNLPIVRPTVDLSPSPGTVERVGEQMIERFNKSAERLLNWEMEKAAR